MTHQFTLVGHPVSHSVSPAIHHAAYVALSIDAQYGLSDCPTEAHVRAVVEQIRGGSLSGANVTIPHKQLALALADVVHESAARVGAANVLSRNELGQVVAYNTDAIALAEELASARLALSQKDAPARDVSQAALIVGAGGAARAAVVACQIAGYRDVRVTARKWAADVHRSSWPTATDIEGLGAQPVAWPSGNSSRVHQEFADVGCLVQATSAGMKGASGGDELTAALCIGAFPRLVAYDLVYNPVETPFLKAADAEGHVAVGGLGMLVGQAASAIEIWLGRRPDASPLLVAAQRALGL